MNIIKHIKLIDNQSNKKEIEMYKLYPIITTLLIILLISNCETPTDSEGTTAVAVEAANAFVAEANETVFDDLRGLIEEEISDDAYDAPGTEIKNKLDMSNSNQKYKEAVALDPTNPGANFGLAFMEVAMTSQDELLVETLNDWADCFNTLFEEEDMGRKISLSNEFKMGVPQSGKLFFSFETEQILNFLPIVTSPEYILHRNDNDCPEISSIQDLLENVFLERFTKATSYLEKAVGKDFVFTITGKMMGDENQDPITLDDTEIYLMKAFLHQVSAMIYAIITYNVNVPYYDLIAGPEDSYSWEWLAQDSDLLTIRNGKESSLASAHTELNNVLNSVESAWDFLKSDNDTEKDIILLEDVTEAAIEFDQEVSEALEEARKVLNEVYTVTFVLEDCSGDYYYYDEECESNEIELKINLKGFMTTPPENLKNIIPDYTIADASCEDEEYNDDSNEYEIINYSCPQLTWDATTCEGWKAGWDLTLGGLFPNMTVEKFFDEMTDLDEEDCEEILGGGGIDF